MANNLSNRRITLISILSLIGFGFSVYLTRHYYDLRSGTAGFKSFCNLSDVANCDVVGLSSYSTLFGSIPLSSVAAGWMLATFFVSLLARNAFWRRDGIRALFAMTVFGTLMSIIYFVIMATVLHTYCLFCLGIDAVNVLMLGLLISLKPEGTTTHGLDRSKWKTVAGITAASLLVVVVALKGMDEQSLSRSSIDQMANEVLATPVVPVNASPELPAFGPDNAPITIVEFSDFQCPHCKIGAYTMHALLNRFPNQVRVVYRGFPLDQACNRVVQQAMHPAACEASRVAYCAKEQGKFAAVYESIFEKQSELAPGVPTRLAEQQGLDKGQLDKCVSSPEAQSKVLKAVEEGIQLNVESTPTFYINGHRVMGAYPLPIWEEIIQRLLKAPH